MKNWYAKESEETHKISILQRFKCATIYGVNVNDEAEVELILAQAARKPTY